MQIIYYVFEEQNRIKISLKHFQDIGSRMQMKEDHKFPVHYKKINQQSGSYYFGA